MQKTAQEWRISVNKKLDLKISESDKKLLVIFLAVCLLAASYFFVFNKGMTKAQDIEAKNEQKEQKVLQLESKIAREKEIVKETKELKEKEKQIKNKYPVDVTEEKAMSIIRDIEKKMDFRANQISFVKGNSAGGQEQVEAANSSEDNSTEETNTSNTAEGKYMAVTMSYKASYSGLKRLNQYVNKNSDRMTIPAISTTFDSETGKLTGTLSLNFYYLPTYGKTYEQPDVAGVSDGVKNIFGSK